MTARVLALPLIFAASSALGQTGAEWNAPRMSLLPGDSTCFAVVAVENRFGMYVAVEALETQHGVVSLSYQTIGGHNAADHDLVDVVDLPPGVVAIPMHLDLPDGETGFFCLMEYLPG